jgi:hypothetical protein
MRPADRMWWISALFACACLVGSIVAPIKILMDGLPAAERQDEPITVYLLLAVVLAVILLLATIIFTAMSVNPYRRQRLRARAKRGNADAMPESGIATHPEKAPAASELPLVLQWRMSKDRRILSLFMGAIQFLSLLVAAALEPVFYFIGWLQGQYVPWQNTSTVISGLVSLIGVICIIVFLEVARRFTPYLLGRPYGVTATADGVEYLTEFGGRRFVPWREIRLLEIESSPDGSLDYYLYGARTIVTWQSNASSHHRESEPVGATLGEMTYRLRALVDLIAARAGLTPRTLSKRLQAKLRAVEASSAPQKAASSTARQEIGCAVLLVVFAVAPVALAIAVLQVPFSGIQPLNDAVAASLFITAALMAGFAVWAVIVTRRMPQAAGEYAIVSAPPSGSETTKYVLPVAIPTSPRVLFIISGILLCFDTLPFTVLAAASLIYQVVKGMQQVFGSTPGQVEFPSFGTVVGYVMIPFAVGGPVMLWIGLRFATDTILADARGLTTHILRQQRTLLWDSVEKLTATRKGNRIVGYAAKSGTDEISWPADVRRVRASAHSGDIVTITPEELVALAAARTGLAVKLLTTDKSANVG